ncbi:MAG: RcnB family protein [Sphingomonas sp.]|nr:RcnB family protein [Sphingomonas sp.]
MQSRLFASIVLATAVLTSPAAAQRIDQSVAQYGAQYGAQMQPMQPMQMQPVQMPSAPQVQWQTRPMQGPPMHTLNQLPQGPRAPRWGGQVNGRWEGGYRAPGGWSAYRRPTRGWRVPSYWIGSNFWIDDFAYYGLATPPRGYRWLRYYDDAVMVDDRGRVYDSVGNIGWDQYEGAYGPAPQDVYQPSYQTTPGRWEGTYTGTWTQAPQPLRAPPPAVTYQTSPLIQVPPGGYYQTYGAGGYASGVTVNGQFYPAGPAGTVSTVTVQSAPVVTTTVTEYVTETRYVTKRKVWRKPVRKWHPAPKCGCGCCHR